jgi:hypothetical protein
VIAVIFYGMGYNSGQAHGLAAAALLKGSGTYVQSSPGEWRKI